MMMMYHGKVYLKIYLKNKHIFNFYKGENVYINNRYEHGLVISKKIAIVKAKEYTPIGEFFNKLCAKKIELASDKDIKLFKTYEKIEQL